MNRKSRLQRSRDIWCCRQFKGLSIPLLKWYYNKKFCHIHTDIYLNPAWRYAK